jgi:hypothetical protein
MNQTATNFSTLFKFFFTAPIPNHAPATTRANALEMMLTRTGAVYVGAVYLLIKAF